MADVTKKFEGDDSVTCHASAALTGGRMVASTTTAPNGGNIVVAVPAAAATVFGVAAQDAASGAKVLVHRPGALVWIEAGATLAAGDLIETDNAGRAVVRSAGICLGRVVQGAASAALALVDFRPALV